MLGAHATYLLPDEGSSQRAQGRVMGSVMMYMSGISWVWVGDVMANKDLAIEHLNEWYIY